MNQTYIYVVIGAALRDPSRLSTYRRISSAEVSYLVSSSPGYLPSSEPALTATYRIMSSVPRHKSSQNTRSHDLLGISPARTEDVDPATALDGPGDDNPLQNSVGLCQHSSVSVAGANETGEKDGKYIDVTRPPSRGEPWHGVAGVVVAGSKPSRNVLG